MRRPRLTRLARTALAVAVAAGAVVAASPAGPATAATTQAPVAVRSGLPWASGAYIPTGGTASHTAFEGYRGAPTDVAHAFAPRRSWAELADVKWLFGAWKNQPRTVVYSFPMIPEDQVSTLADCAAGRYNAAWRSVGQQLASSGAPASSVIRLGWEFNGPWNAWAARTPAEYAACWRQVHSAVEAAAPAVRWDWTVNRGANRIGIDARAAYPGDAYVDFVGIDSYDWYPGVLSEEAWQEQYAGPWGLKFWADFARSKGKRLSVPEWGVHPGTRASAASGGDNAFYIRKMFSFFYEQRANLAYEIYFNSDADYYAGSLFAPVQVPKASAEYAAQVRALVAGAVPPAATVYRTDVTYDAAGVSVAAPRAVTAPSGTTLSADLFVDRPVTFAKQARIVVWDTARRRPATNLAFSPSTVRHGLTLSGLVDLQPDEYAAKVTYSVDGTTWLSGPTTRFSVAPPLTYNTEGVHVPAPAATPSAGSVAVRAELSVNRGVTFARLPRIAIRDSAGRGTDAQGSLDTAYAGSATTSTSLTLSGQRALAPGTYTAFVAYSVDGRTWVNGPRTAFVVPAPVQPAPQPAPAQPAPAPTSYDAHGVALVAPKASPTSTGVTLTAPVSVNRALTFARLPRVAVRDSAGRGVDARGSLDTAYAGTATFAAGSTVTLTGTRGLAPGTYTAFVAYSVDGTTWVNGPRVTFTVS